MSTPCLHVAIVPRDQSQSVRKDLRRVDGLLTAHNVVRIDYLHDDNEFYIHLRGDAKSLQMAGYRLIY
jgi:hypothetical protein